MGLTIYLLDEMRQQRAAIRSSITELVHSEADGGLEAEIAQGHSPKAGEYLAFVCRDGRARLFEIQTVDELDSEGLDYIIAKDAAIAELGATVVTGAQIGNRRADTAMLALLDGTGWELGEVTANGDVGNIADAEYETVADAMERIADTAKVRLVPHYELTGGQVTGKRIDMLSAEPVYRGRIVSAKNARDIVLTDERPPMGRVYALGGWSGTGSERQRVTLERAAWSEANGDPADKPAGQLYADAPGWTGAYRRSYVFQSPNQTDSLELMREAWEDLAERSREKLVGTANAGAVRLADGRDLREVYPEDLVGVRAESGRATKARVANVRWNYVYQELTQLEFGEKQSRSWIQTQIAQQQAATNENVGRLRGGLSSVSGVVEDNGVELYRAIEQLVELETGTAVEFNEVWIDLDAARAEIELKASKTVTDALGEEITDLSTTFTVAFDGVRATIQDSDQIVSELKATIDGLEHWVTDADGNVAELTNTVRGLESTVQSVDGRMVSLSNTVDGLRSTVMDQNGGLGTLRVSVDEVAQHVRDINGNFGNLTVQADRVAATVATADGKLGRLEVTAEDIVAAIQDQDGQMAQLRVEIDKISSSVKDAEGKIGEFTVQADRISGTLTNASGKLTALMELTEDRFATVLGDIEKLGDELGDVTGSAIWQQRNSITAAVGKMYVDVNGQLHIREGSGLRIDESGSSYGVYTNNNLTAGILVNKINGGTVKIKAARLELDGLVTAKELETQVARLDNLTSGVTEAAVLKTKLLNCVETMLYKEQIVSWKATSVMTSAGLSTSRNIVTVMGANGSPVTIDYVTSVKLNPSTTSLSYMGR